MSDTFTIAGVPVDLNAEFADPIRFSEKFGAIPSLTIQKRGVALPGVDPWVGKEITWTNNGTLRFVGDIVSVTPSFSGVGWVLTYQCLGLRNRLDWFPHTDSNSGVDSSQFNLMAENSLYDPARAGRTVGQILGAVLTMPTNAAWCNLCGIGNYTGLPTAPALPSVTTADLAAMTVIPPHEINVNGEKFGAALDGFVQQWAPNYRMWIDPGGNFRFKDLRTFPATTFTMGSDPVEPTDLSRDVGECFQRVVVRGQPIAVLAVLKLSNGDITENFAHDGLTNSQAKAAWSPSDFQQPGKAQDTGSCTCTTTTTIVVTSSVGSTFWGANYWDQSHQQGWINVSSSTIPGYTQYWSARIVACSALSPGGSSTITIDAPLPDTSYNKYTITGLATGGSVVWTQYQIANTNLWPRVTRQTTYPQPLVSPGGGSVSLTSSAVGIVLWSLNGSPPYMSFPSWFTFNSTTGNIRFASPTWMIANNAPPADVWVALPIQTNPNTAIEPPDVGSAPQFEGTSHTVDGLSKTLTVTQDDWRDPASLPQVQAYASDLLDTIKDAVIEGSVVYYGLYAPALTFGMGVNVAGADGGVLTYTTGWEAANLPVTGVDLDWTQGEGMLYRTTLHCSNRKDHCTAEMFMHPQRTGLRIGTESEVWNPYNIPQPGSDKGKRKDDEPRDKREGADQDGWKGGGKDKPAGAGGKAGMEGGGLFPTMQEIGIPTDPARWAAENGVPTDLGAYMQSIGADPASYGLDFGPDSYAGIPGRGKGKKGAAKAADKAKPPEPAKKAAEDAKKADAAAQEPKKDAEAKPAKAGRGKKPRPPKPPRKKQHGLRPSAEYQERKDREDAARKQANADNMARFNSDDENDTYLGELAAEIAGEPGMDREKALEQLKNSAFNTDHKPLTPAQANRMDSILSKRKDDARRTQVDDAIKKRQDDNARAREDMMKAAKPDQDRRDKRAADQQQLQRDAVGDHKKGFDSRVKDREDFMKYSPQARQRQAREEAIAAGKDDAAARKDVAEKWNSREGYPGWHDRSYLDQQRDNEIATLDAMHNPDKAAFDKAWDKRIEDAPDAFPYGKSLIRDFRKDAEKEYATGESLDPTRIAARNQQIERDQREAANAQRAKAQQERQGGMISAADKKKPTGAAE